MRVVEPDHIVLVSADPERLIEWYRSRLGLDALRLDEWRRDEVPFVSLRVNDGFLIDVTRGTRPEGDLRNVDHVALVVDGVDLDVIAEAGEWDVEFGPADLFGARGVGRGLYVRDPDGNRVELRTY